MIELATNTITAESRIGNHNAWTGTIFLRVNDGIEGLFQTRKAYATQGGWSTGNCCL
jgi:hypothetical protein